MFRGQTTALSLFSEKILKNKIVYREGSIYFVDPFWF